MFPGSTSSNRPFALFLSVLLLSFSQLSAPTGGGFRGTAQHSDMRYTCGATKLFDGDVEIWSVILSKGVGGPEYHPDRTRAYEGWLLYLATQQAGDLTCIICILLLIFAFLLMNKGM